LDPKSDFNEFWRVQIGPIETEIVKNN